MRSLGTKSICLILISTITAKASLAEDNSVAPIQVFQGFITDESGLGSNKLMKASPVSFSIINRDIRGKGQTGSNRVTFNFPPNVICEGSFEIPALETQISPPIGSEGTFQLHCTPNLLAEGKLKETDQPGDGDFSSIWQANGTAKDVTPIANENFNSSAKLASSPVSFTLKISRKKH